jgi:hypothetical protein
MSSAGARLEAIHAEVVDEPLPEWLEAAACGPAVKHLAHLAMHTAGAHDTEAEWRQWVRIRAPEVTDKLIDEAEECMRGAGLWPWRT